MPNVQNGIQFKNVDVEHVVSIRLRKSLIYLPLSPI